MDVMHSAGDKEWEDDEVDLTCIADEEEDVRNFFLKKYILF